MTTFGERFRELRRRAGLSAERLGASLGLHRSSIVSYERDEKMPSIEIVKGLEAAGLDWVYLIMEQPAREFAVDRWIDWQLIIDAIEAIEARNVTLKRKLTRTQRLEVLRNVYRIEVDRKRQITASVENTLKLVA